MKSLNWKIALAAAAIGASTGALAQTHWGYEGEAGPQNWSKLNPKFVMCALGRNQSPIDISGSAKAELKPLKFTYAAGAQEIAIVNNGHTIQVNYAPGSSVTVDGREFELKQFHFHSPSENKIDGKQYPLESHLVHADKESNLAVVAVIFQEGAPSAALTKLWEKMPAKTGDKNPLPTGMSVAQ
ncbi:MAG: carbonic anhydrase, partial [Gammaproteobacteria bacterium]